MEQDDPQPEGEASHEAKRGGVDWEAIKCAVIHSDWSLGRIAEEHGAGETTIRSRMQRDGWVRLVGTKPVKPGRRVRTPGAAREKRATPKKLRKRKMIERLFQVLDAKMRELEERMAARDQDLSVPQSAADAERDARSLNALARLYAKLVELDEAAKQSGAGEGRETRGAKGRDEDADRLRQDLALRLKRLDRTGHA